MEIRNIVFSEKYTDGYGEEKTIWHRVGTMFIKNENGELKISMKFSSYPAGDNVNLVAFKREDRNNQQVQQQEQQPVQQHQESPSSPQARAARKERMQALVKKQKENPQYTQPELPTVDVDQDPNDIPMSEIPF